MQRPTASLVLAFLVLASIAPRMALADSLEKASQKDMARLMRAASMENSAYGAWLIGETPDRIYIQYETAIHAGSFFSKAPQRTVYWIPRPQVTAEQLAQLKAYKDKYLYVFALRRDMTRAEAAAAIGSLGFGSREFTNRPAGGWSENDGTPGNIQGKALAAQRTSGKEVLIVETYGVGPALSRAATLYLFFGPDGKLLQYYQLQDN
jgi:hypothetical protein